MTLKGNSGNLKALQLYSGKRLRDDEIAKLDAFLKSSENGLASSESADDIEDDKDTSELNKKRKADYTPDTNRVSETLEKLREAEARIKKLERDLVTIRQASIDVFSKSKSDIIRALQEEKKNVSILSARVAEAHLQSQQHKVDKIQAETLIAELRRKIADLQTEKGKCSATPRLATLEETTAYRTHILERCLDGDDVEEKIAAAMTEMFDLLLAD